MLLQDRVIVIDWQSASVSEPSLQCRIRRIPLPVDRRSLEIMVEDIDLEKAQMRLQIYVRVTISFLSSRLDFHLGPGFDQTPKHF